MALTSHRHGEGDAGKSSGTREGFLGKAKALAALSREQGLLDRVVHIMNGTPEIVPQRRWNRYRCDASVRQVPVRSLVRDRV